MWTLLQPENLRHKLRIAAAVTGVMTIMGPFGTYDALSLGPRFFYWALAIFGCAIVFEVAVEAAILHLRTPGGLPVHISLGAGLAALPASAVILGLEVLFRDGMPVADWPWLYLCVLLVGVAMSFLSFHPTFAPLRPPPPRPVPFLDRLPEHAGARLVSLSMRDHYVEAVTDQDRVMIHLRFQDALAEVSSYPGLRIHRSHWVAFDAIEAVERQGRKLRVRTRAGQHLPVSDPYRPDLRAAQTKGWLTAPSKI